MTIAERWLLPEGIDEILPPQSARIEALRRALLDEYQCWGYDLIQPPTAEYLESLLTGAGHDLDLLTFKITDQQNGRLMGISADRTQQVARMDAHSIQKQGVARYAYCQEVLHTRPTHLLSSRSPLQIGAELYGFSGLDSDVEMVSLMIHSLIKADLPSVTVDLGHIGIYQALVAEVAISDAEQTTLFGLLRQRSIPELNAFVEALPINQQHKDWLLGLPNMAGSLADLTNWRAQLTQAPQKVLDALDSLGEIATVLEARFSTCDIHIDLAELRDFSYHTGLVFSAFVPGFGQPVARGGRYDHTGEVFGRARPAIGFSSDLKILAQLTTQASVTSGAIQAPAQGDEALLLAIRSLRERGERVIQVFTDQPFIDELNCDRVLIKRGSDWVVEHISTNGHNENG